jgi:hypothetical protein
MRRLVQEPDDELPEGLDALPRLSSARSIASSTATIRGAPTACATTNASASSETIAPM